MTTSIAAIALAFVCCATLQAQQKLDITLHDGNRLRPGATQKEIREWIKSQTIESAFGAVIQQQASQTAPSVPPAVIQAVKVFEIRSRTLDQILKRHTDLEETFNALYVHYDNLVSQELINAKNASSFPENLIRIIKAYEIRSKILAQLVMDYPQLKPEADALYVQYDNLVAEEIFKMLPAGR